jgi:dTDP-4-amino-4,6-dideoxy-D-galactose acyltransferase
MSAPEARGAAPEAAAAAPCRLLAWDSEHFGLRIARLTTGRPTGDDLARALAWCRGEAIDCLYLLADAADPTSIRCAEAAGFGLVDVRVTLEHSLGPSGGPPATAGIAIRSAAAPGDLAALGAIAAAAHRGTRFWNDPRFPDADCGRLYRAWIENSARGWADAVLVAEAAAARRDAGPLAGYVTCHLDGAAGSIGLVGVDAGCRGAGLGGALVAAALDWLAAHGAARAEVVTQGANIAAQRLYQRAGFVTREIGLWYHLWPRGRADARDTPGSAAR